MIIVVETIDMAIGTMIVTDETGLETVTTMTAAGTMDAMSLPARIVILATPALAMMTGVAVRPSLLRMVAAAAMVLVVLHHRLLPVNKVACLRG